ncbi:MAG: S1 family peptidase, partial [Actinobacteria bacterium]|nr:S1 family peptidase [Actinomycetota bacterium]
MREGASVAEVHPELRQVKKDVEPAFLNLPGVVGVDIGYKEVQGRPTGDLAIRVLVEQKRDVPGSQQIPAEVQGFPTDVIERKFELHVLGVSALDLEPQVDAVTYDQLTGGISIGPCRLVNGQVFVGTLGAVVKDNESGEPLLLSNFHVLCVDKAWSVGDALSQPGVPDSGRCPASVAGNLLRASLGDQVDCAVGQVTRGTSCAVAEIGPLKGQGAVALGDVVRKRGRTTGLTYGVVDTVDLTVTMTYGGDIGDVTLTNQIGIKPDSTRNPKFGDRGDSGSVLVNDRSEVVGLYAAGSTTDEGYGMANPIGAVLAALNVSICTEDTVSPGEPPGDPPGDDQPPPGPFQGPRGYPPPPCPP